MQVGQDKRVLGPLEESASGECRYERPADRAVAAESAGAGRTWRGKFIVLVLPGRYLSDAARSCDVRMDCKASLWRPNSASANTPLARGPRFLKDRCDGLLDEGRPRTINDDQVPPSSSERCIRRQPTRRTDRSARWLRKLAFPTLRSADCGQRSACSRTVARRSSCRAIRCSSTRYAISSAFTYPHRTEPLSSASMRKARFGHLIASNRSCR
jgi:hypothetical protein